jgi:hypothetical protein
MREWIWEGKLWSAFKNVAIFLSFGINILLLVFLIVTALYIIPTSKSIAEPLVGDLHQSFVDMGEAHITRTIVVQDTIPVVFDLPVQTETVATLTQPVPMTIPTTFVLPGGGGFINGTVSLELPAGTGLPVEFNTTVPVSETVPIEMAVAVDIPLEETELNEPFSDLQMIIAPIDSFLSGLPANNREFFERLVNGNQTEAEVQPPEQASVP